MSDSLKGFEDFYTQKFWPRYNFHMWREAKKYPPEKLGTAPKFLLNAHKVILHVGSTHIGIEYVSKFMDFGNIPEKGILSLVVLNHMGKDDFLAEVIGFPMEGTSDFKLPLTGMNPDIFAFSLDAVDLLAKGNWNFQGENMNMMMNCAGFQIPEGEFARITNSFFFVSNGEKIQSRNIQWLDIFPIDLVDHGDELEFRFPELPLEKAAEDELFRDVAIPKSRDFQKTSQLNRFVEMISTHGISEPKITEFLSEPENQFILKLAFGAKAIKSQCKLEWQGETKDPIVPDFMIEELDGYFSVLEFKLPGLKNSSVVGRENREAFSAEVNSYVAQTRVYGEYFTNPLNREFALRKHGIKALEPKRTLVLGRSWELDHPLRKQLEQDYKNLRVVTYDDLVALALSLLYS